MKYLKLFESNRMPKRCSQEEATDKLNSFKREKLSENEIKWICSKFSDIKLAKSSIYIKDNILISKLCDSWFIIFTEHDAEYYIADEFIEVQNFLQSI